MSTKGERHSAVQGGNTLTFMQCARFSRYTRAGLVALILGSWQNSIAYAEVPKSSEASSTTAPSAPSPSRSLKEAFQAALVQSETVGMQKELLIQANEVNTQAIAALFPTISGTATVLTQATPSNVTGSTLFPSNQNTIKITANQPLFRGFRDFAALRQRKDLVGAQESAIQNAARQLFYDLSTAYYNVLVFQHDESNFEAEIEVNRKRLKELQGFFKIGRSRRTDLLTFEANIASLEAQLETTRGQLESAKEVLAYFTGWDRTTVLKDEEPLPTAPEKIDFYLSKIDERPDVKTAVANVQANEEGIPIAWGGHLPSLDLFGNYYATRPGALSDVHWDVSVTLTIPIFQGGAIQSQVRQWESVAKQSRLLLSQTRRIAEQEIRTFLDILNADMKKLAKLTQLTDISSQNYDTQIQYYRNGLVTNLDVLQSITTFKDAQRLRDRQKETVRLDSAKLQAAAGLRPEIHIDVSSSGTSK